MSGTTIYLSAMEPTHYYKRAADVGYQYYLVSFLYLLQRKSLRNVEYRKNDNPDHKFLIDSGAHTLQGDDLKAFGLDDYKRYMDTYAEWLVNNQQYIHASVELDVESAVGMEQVKKWQDDFFIPFEKSGNEVIYVWHPERGVPEFENMCRRHRWVGLAQDFFDSGQDIVQFSHIARRYLTRMHGFGITSMEHLLKNTFYSTDSTTWKGGEMYGVSYIWDEKQSTMKPIVSKRAEQRAAYSDYFESLGLDTEAIIAGDSRTLTSLALHSWKKLQEYLHVRFGRTHHWDLRPAPSAVAFNAPLEEIKEYLDDIPIIDYAESSEEDLRTFYAIIAALLNREYDSIRETSEMLNPFLEEILEVSVNLTEDSTEEYINNVCADLSSLIYKKALPRSEATPRSSLEPMGYPENIRRNDFPVDGLTKPEYRDIY